MTSSRPYLIRAIYDWILDNELTPYIAISNDVPGVQIPEEHIEDGRIVLNISPDACRGLHLGNDRVVFSARFSGQPFQIYAPPQAVMAVYAKENGRGMVFGPDEEEGGDEPPTPTSTPEGDEQRSTSKKGKPSLKVVK